MKEIAKLGGILFIIAAICSGLVGYASEITKEPIAVQEGETKTLAMQEVLPSADAFEEAGSTHEIAEIQVGTQDGKMIGYALRVIPKGYAGPIEIMVGVTTDGMVEGIKILSHSETPGLGANASEPSFTGQFKEKAKLLTVVKSASVADDEVSTITGATITSVAITDGVNTALEYVQGQGGGAQ